MNLFLAVLSINERLGIFFGAFAILLGLLFWWFTQAEKKAQVKRDAFWSKVNDLSERALKSVDADELKAIRKELSKLYEDYGYLRYGAAYTKKTEIACYTAGKLDILQPNWRKS
jgi:hypothetical protein